MIGAKIKHLLIFLACMLNVGQGQAFDKKIQYQSNIGYFHPLYFLSHFNNFQPFPEKDLNQHGKPDQKIALFDQEDARTLLLLACENYQIILPKQLGCAFCQLSHTMLSSARYQHFLKRQRDLIELKRLLTQEPFSAEKVEHYLKREMEPFKGQFGKQFYAQCILALARISLDHENDSKTAPPD